jgi:hypothetical protein
MADQITTTIGTISGVPDRDDSDNFNTECDAFFEDMPDAIADINAVAGEMNTLATSVEQDAADAETAKTAAEAAQVLAVAAANATVYAAGTTYAAGDIVLDPGNDYVAYTSQQGSNTGHTPNSDDGTWWEMTISDVADTINSATGKTTPVDADLFGIVDSAASNVLKKLTWANIKATLKTYFDVLYLATANEYTKTQNFNATTLTDAANISWDLESNQVAKVTLAGNRTLDNPTNMVDGATYILRVIQDGTGSRTLAYGSAYKWAGGTAPTMTTTAAAIDILTFISDGTNMFGVSSLEFS